MNEASESKQDDIMVILAEGIRQLGLADENTASFTTSRRFRDGVKNWYQSACELEGRGHFYYAVHYITMMKGV